MTAFHYNAHHNKKQKLHSKGERDMKKCNCGQGKKRCTGKCVIDKINTSGAIFLLLAIVGGMKKV